MSFILNLKILLQEQKSLIPVTGAYVHTVLTMDMTKIGVIFLNRKLISNSQNTKVILG